MSSSPASFFVPTLDIDLAWHTHQLRSVKYNSDCFAYVERYVDHNDRVEEDRLSNAFDITCRAWEVRLNFRSLEASLLLFLGSFPRSIHTLRLSRSWRKSHTETEPLPQGRTRRSSSIRTHPASRPQRSPRCHAPFRSQRRIRVQPHWRKRCGARSPTGEIREAAAAGEGEGRVG